MTGMIDARTHSRYERRASLPGGERVSGGAAGFQPTDCRQKSRPDAASKRALPPVACPFFGLGTFGSGAGKWWIRHQHLERATELEWEATMMMDAFKVHDYTYYSISHMRKWFWAYTILCVSWLSTLVLMARLDTATWSSAARHKQINILHGGFKSHRYHHHHHLPTPEYPPTGLWGNPMLVRNAANRKGVVCNVS